MPAFRVRRRFGGAYGGVGSSNTGGTRGLGASSFRPRYRRLGRKLTRYAINRSLRSVVRQIRPEMKMVRMAAGIDTTTYNPTATFTTRFPSSWANIDTAPGQGTGSHQRIGNSYTRRQYDLDLKFLCNDANVLYRFVVFRWKMEMGPDTATWPNPILDPNQSWFSAFFPADSTDWADVLYQTSGVFYTTFTGLTNTASGSLPATNGNNRGYLAIRKSFYFNEHVDTAADSVLNASGGSTGSDTSFKGRIYWCMVTTNAAGSDMAVVGTWTEKFTDM